MRQGRSAPERPSRERPIASRQDAAATSNSLCRRVRPSAREYRRRVRLTRWAVVVSSTEVLSKARVRRSTPAVPSSASARS